MGEEEKGHQALIILTLSHVLQYNRSQYQLLAGSCSEVLLLSFRSKPLDRDKPLDREIPFRKTVRLNQVVMWILLIANVRIANLRTELLCGFRGALLLLFLFLLRDQAVVIRGQKRPLRDDVDIAVAVGLFEFYVLLALLFAFRILKTLTNTTYNNDNSYLTSKNELSRSD